MRQKKLMSSTDVEGNCICLQNFFTETSSPFKTNLRGILSPQRQKKLHIMKENSKFCLHPEDLLGFILMRLQEDINYSSFVVSLSQQSDPRFPSLSQNDGFSNMRTKIRVLLFSFCFSTSFPCLHVFVYLHAAEILCMTHLWAPSVAQDPPPQVNDPHGIFNIISLKTEDRFKEN